MQRGGWRGRRHRFQEENQGSDMETLRDMAPGTGKPAGAPRALPPPCRLPHAADVTTPCRMPPAVRAPPRAAGATGPGGAGAAASGVSPSRSPGEGGSSPCRVLQQQRPRVSEDDGSQTRGPQRAAPSASRAESLCPRRRLRLRHTCDSQQGPVPKTSEERWPGGRAGQGRGVGESRPPRRRSPRAGFGLPPAAEPPC